MTGATGLVGSHVARLLVERGDSVRVTVREQSRLDNIADLDVERVTCDIFDRRALRRALRGVTRLFHVAGLTSFRASADTQYRVNVDGTRAVPLVARAGEFSLHHTHLLHSSAPNRGRDRRIGVGIIYIPTRVRHVGPRRLTASLVRGHDRYGHFDPEPRPGADFDAEGVAAELGDDGELVDLGRRLDVVIIAEAAQIGPRALTIRRVASFTYVQRIELDSSEVG